MGRVFVVQRWQHAAGIQQFAVARAGLGATGQDFVLQAAACGDGGKGQGAGGGDASDHLDLFALDHTHLALAGGILELDQSHGDDSRCRVLAGTLRIHHGPA
ncbi:hypothetical protein D9M71_55440 [compost metagenome]